MPQDDDRVGGGRLMWPDPGEALSRTIEAEAAIADLYAEALRRWAPDISAAVLPALTAAALPPDPDAASQQQAAEAWSAVTEAVVIAGVSLLWAAAVMEAMNALGIPLPSITGERGEDGSVTVALPEYEPVVLQIIARAVDDADLEVLRHADMMVDATPVLRDSRDDVLQAQRARAVAIPAAVTENLAAVQRDTEFPPTGGVSRPVDEQRAAVAATLEPSSPAMRTLAREEGYQAAGVLNHAVIAAAEQSNAEFGEELQKCWIATLDGRTRPTHWAADGQRVDLAAHFTVGGEQLFVPGDETASPAEWKNCRCRVGVLAKDEALPDEVDRHTERLDGRDSVAIRRDGRTQAEEIERRRAAGNVRARDDEDGIGRVAAGGWTAPSEENSMPDNDTDDTYLVFTDALFAVTGTPTSDHRMLAADINLTFRDTPMPLQWCERSEGGHAGSVTVGVIEDIRLDGGEVRASGYMLNNDNAMKAIDLVSHGVCNPSIDIVASVVATYEDGTVVTEENFDPERTVYETLAEGEILATTIVATPAFGSTRIALNELRETRAKALVASALATADRPRVTTYDPALFADPKLTRPTAPTMNPETGRIYGHLAEFGRPYRGGNGEPTPRNRNGYANFHTSQVMLDSGKQLSVGRLTVQGGHADTTPGVTVATARAHYDNVCTAFGLVRVGEDAFGIWFSGVPAPGVDPDVFQQGMTAPLSGDWRDCGYGLDMIGAHAVNSPGFPIYSAVTGPDGQEVALVASLGPSHDAPGTVGGFALTRENLATLLTEVVDAVDQRNAQRQAAMEAAAAHRTRAEVALAAAHAAVGEPPTPTERVTEILEQHAKLAEVFDVSRMPKQLKDYWLRGAGAAKVRWGTKGSFDRCVRAVNAKIAEDDGTPLPPNQIQGLCANLYKEATGRHPGRKG